MSGIEEETGVTTVTISPRVYHCGYVYIGVGSGARNPAVRSCMLLQSEPVNKVVMNTAGFGIG